MVLLRIFKLIMKILQRMVPVKRKRLLFTSFNGHYSDSPKCISEKIYELAPHLEQVWLVKKQHLNKLPQYAKAVDIDSRFRAFWYSATAHIIIDNVYGDKAVTMFEGKMTRAKFRLLTFLNKKPGQYVFTTWHGTPLKRMGRDQIGLSVLDFSCPNTTMLLGNQHSVDIMRHLTFGKIHMELLGTPRNDILFSGEDKKDELKERLGLPKDKKIILFAPTFRSDDASGTKNTNIDRSGINQLEQMDFGLFFETLTKVFGGEWAMVCRFHYHVESKIDWQELSQKCPFEIINGNLYDDMAEYLICTDVLLTDISSSFFDFIITKKPCFSFFPDLGYYQNIERGFYMPLDRLPFSVAENFSDLIKNISEFNEDEYTKKVESFMESLGIVDSPESTARASEYILKRGFCKREH